MIVKRAFTKSRAKTFSPFFIFYNYYTKNFVKSQREKLFSSSLNSQTDSGILHSRRVRKAPYTEQNCKPSAVPENDWGQWLAFQGFRKLGKPVAQHCKLFHA